MFLLDTCTFLWWATGDPRVPEAVKVRLREPDEQVFLSVVSVWEICTKFALKKLALPEPPEKYVTDRRRRMAIASLALEESDVLGIAKLPRHHRDPFDRMLVAHAIERGLVLVTPDAQVRAYPCRSWWGESSQR